MALREKGVVLLDFWASPFGQRCRIALAEKGVEYEYREQNLLLDKSPAPHRAGGEGSGVRVVLDRCRQLFESSSKLWKLKGEAREEAMKEFVEVLKVMEGVLGDKNYFGGEAFGFLDVALVPFVSRFHSYEKCGRLSVEEAAPKLVAWGKRCMERESVSKTLYAPEKVYEFVSLLRKKYGTE